MGKKMKLIPFLSSSKNYSSSLEASRSSPSCSSSSSSWPWPSCAQTRTLSFTRGNDIFKTINSAYFDTTPSEALAETPTLDHDHSSEDEDSLSSTLDHHQIESVIDKGLRSERLFFEPKAAGETSSLISSSMEAKEAAPSDNMKMIPFKECVALSMDSPDPIGDFRKSMEEMVEAHELKDWENLEELLCWYLRVNGKSNHGYIVGAFVDLMVGLALFNTSNSSSSSPISSNSTNYCSCNNIIMNNSPSSPLSIFYNSTSTYSSSSSSSSSSSTTPCVSSIVEHEEEVQSATTSPCLASLLEGEEDQIHEEDGVVDDEDDGSS